MTAEAESETVECMEPVRCPRHFKPLQPGPERCDAGVRVGEDELTSTLAAILLHGACDQLGLSTSGRKYDRAALRSGQSRRVLFGSSRVLGVIDLHS
jgi:hypothetical protein